MLYDIIRSIVQTVLRDKIWLGLLIVGILGIFMVGANKNEPAVNRVASQTAQPAAQPSQPSQPAATSDDLDPELATNFVKWWMNVAFDYDPHTAVESHHQAFTWMTQDAQQAFQTAFWTPQVAQGIQDGSVSASFKTSNIQAEAINPDGSIVIGVYGTINLQTTGQPMSQQLRTDFLVRRAPEGLRVAGLYSRAI